MVCECCVGVKGNSQSRATDASVPLQ